MADLIGLIRVFIAALPGISKLLRKRIVNEAEELLVTAYVKSKGHFQRWELGEKRWTRIQSEGFQYRRQQIGGLGHLHLYV